MRQRLGTLYTVAYRHRDRARQLPSNPAIMRGMPGSNDDIAQFKRLYTDGVIDGVAVVAADANACKPCTELADTVYLPSRLPELPIIGCYTEGGCRCRYEPSFTVYE